MFTRVDAFAQTAQALPPVSGGVFLGKLWAHSEGTSRAHWQRTEREREERERGGQAQTPEPAQEA